jgi:hypothetical protein
VVLDVLDALSEVEHGVDMPCGDGNDAVGVGVAVVAGNDLHVADHDRYLPPRRNTPGPCRGA